MRKHTDLVAINTVFLSLKIFSYLNNFPGIKLLTTTLSRAREDTLYFILIFLVLILGFVGLSHLSFGAHLQGYSTLLSSLRMNFQLTLGDFDYAAVNRVDPVMSVLYFYPFSLLFVFILTNIFLAIINQTYKDTRESVQLEPDVSVLNSLFYWLARGEEESVELEKLPGEERAA
jgi:hypothetical protein